MPGAKKKPVLREVASAAFKQRLQRRSRRLIAFMMLAFLVVGLGLCGTMMFVVMPKLHPPKAPGGRETCPATSEDGLEVCSGRGPCSKGVCECEFAIYEGANCTKLSPGFVAGAVGLFLVVAQIVPFMIGLLSPNLMTKITKAMMKSLGATNRTREEHAKALEAEAAESAEAGTATKGGSAAVAPAPE